MHLLTIMYSEESSMQARLFSEFAIVNFHSKMLEHTCAYMSLPAQTLISL